MEDPALKWFNVRWGLAGRRISRFAIVSGKTIGLLCLIAAIGCSILYLIQPWLLSRHLGKVDAQLSINPINLPNKAEAVLSNSSTENSVFMLRLPNNGIVGTTKLSQTLLIRFPNGTLEIHGPLRDQDSLVFGSVHSDADAQKLFTQETLGSQLKLLQAAMPATPGQVKWWRFRSSQNRRASLLLLLKFVALTEYSPLHSAKTRPIYTIACGQLRGFQLGNPEISPYDTHIDLFGEADFHLALDISGVEGHDQVLTQEEINAIIASIQLTSDH